MAAPILEFTTHDEVRSLLGVSAKELANVTIELPIYHTGLLEDLYDLNPRALETFQSLPPEAGQSPMQSRFSRLLKQFSTYSVAHQLCKSLSMFAPRSIGDGKANVSRFLDPYTQTIQRIEQEFGQSRDRLEDALDDLLAENRPATGRILFSAVGLAVDPVTSGG